MKTVNIYEAELPHKPQRLGFMKGMGKIPDDFDTMYADEIARMFNGEDEEMRLPLASYPGPILKV
jgi:hypothetical protein